MKPVITVIGVGGAGSNAVNNMVRSKLQGAIFGVANTDAQALEQSLAEHKIQLGENITKGLGAGALPQVGKAAAEESINQIKNLLQGSNMVFITAGMGGGTGTGAAPVIAKAAREQNILTVAVVTKPFQFEGAHRMALANEGLKELEKHVDTMIVIPNQNLFRVANEKTTFAEAFNMADNVLRDGVKGVTDLITMPGLINLDFADIVTIMSKMGKAMMGTGEGEGENRAILAAEAAISNPLLDHSSMKGALGVLINITGGPDLTLFEVDETANRIREEVDENANIIFGSTFNPELEGKIRVSVFATGIDANLIKEQFANNQASPLTKVNDNILGNSAVITEKAITDFTIHETVDLAEVQNDNQDNLSTQEEKEEAIAAPLDPRMSFKTNAAAESKITENKQAAKEEFQNFAQPDFFGYVGQNLDEELKASNIAQAETSDDSGFTGWWEKMTSKVFRTAPASSSAKTIKIDIEQKESHLRNDLDANLEIPAFLRKKK